MKDGMIQLDLGAVTQPRTLFKPVSWLAKIDFINHLILFNNVLITVLSEKKGGKTCFGTLLQSNLDQQIKSISLTATVPSDRKTIIQDVANKLHLNCDETTDINSLVAQINERKAHVLLIIDDAHHLPESFIKEAMIAIKSQENFGFFHLCLISDYSVVATLNQLAVEQFSNLIHTIEIGPLNESETRTYVLQKGMNERLLTKPLADAQFKQFYSQTKGNLAKINSSLELFILNCTTTKTPNKLGLIKKAGIAATVVLAASASYIYYDTMSQESQLNALVTQSNKTIQQPQQALAMPKIEPLVSEIASWQDSSTRQLVQHELPKKQILDELNDENDNLTTVAIVDKVLVIPTVKPKQEEPVQITAPVQKQIESKLVKITTIKHNKVAKKAPAAGLYTIQLAASHNIGDIKRFKQSNKLFTKAKVHHITNAKGNWYILTLGSYSNRNQALLESRKLPTDLAKLNPWIRPTAGLKSIG